MKILTTQLNGAVSTLFEKNTMELEFAVRTLAQAVVNEGTIWIWSSPSLSWLVSEFTDGENALPRARKLEDEVNITSVDRILFLTNATDDSAFLQTIEQYALDCPFVVVAPDAPDTTLMADAWIAIRRNKGVLPREDGSRMCNPYGFLLLALGMYFQASLAETLEDFFFEIEANEEEQ
ncbi:MAG: DUF2529 family protein [Bacilli bacterium]